MTVQLLVLAALVLTGCSPEPLPEGWGQAEPLVLRYGDSYWQYVVTREPGRLSVMLGQPLWGYTMMKWLFGALLLGALVGLWEKLGALAIPLTGAFGCLLVIASYFFGNTTSIYSAEGVSLEKRYFLNTHAVVTHIPPEALRAVEVVPRTRVSNDLFERWAVVRLVHKEGEHEVIRFVRYGGERWDVQEDNAEAIADAIREVLP